MAYPPNTNLRGRVTGRQPVTASLESVAVARYGRRR
jgi:hypothetical protein